MQQIIEHDLRATNVCLNHLVVPCVLVLCVLDKMRYNVTSSLVFFSVGLLTFLFLLDPKKHLHVEKKFVGIIIKKTMLDPYIEIITILIYNF